MNTNTHDTLTPKSLKRDIRSVCLAVGGVVLTMQLVALIVTVILLVIGMALDGSFVEMYMQGNASSYTNDQLTTKTAEFILKNIGLIQIISIFIASLWMFAIRGKRFITIDITKRASSPTPRIILQLIVLMFALQFAMWLFNLLLLPIQMMLDLSVTEAMDDGVMSILSSPIGILYIVIIGPIVEELIFRGAVMRKLEPYGANFAIITSSILFGLYHIILFQAVFAFFLGLLLAYTAGRFSLKWAIGLHILNNLLATLAGLNTIVSFLLLALYAASFVLAIVFLVTKRSVFATQKWAGAPRFLGVFKTAYSSPLFIVYVALTVIAGILYI